MFIFLYLYLFNVQVINLTCLFCWLIGLTLYLSYLIDVKLLLLLLLLLVTCCLQSTKKVCSVGYFFFFFCLFLFDFYRQHYNMSDM